MKKREKKWAWRFRRNPQQWEWGPMRVHGPFLAQKHRYEVWLLKAGEIKGFKTLPVAQAFAEKWARKVAAGLRRINNLGDDLA